MDPYPLPGMHIQVFNTEFSFKDYDAYMQYVLIY